jgi:hypothetical protein
MIYSKFRVKYNEHLRTLWSQLMPRTVKASPFMVSVFDGSLFTPSLLVIAMPAAAETLRHLTFGLTINNQRR